uniref:Uncharacterized protein n=1 Tax=Cacopsylla melanoneura TaxID=428564 RepID=A0A8D8TBW2_9HEMI
MQIDLPNETSVSSKQNCCSLKVFFEFGSTHIPSVNTDKLDKDQYSQSTIEPLDVKDANSLIDIINSEGTSTEALIWMGDKDSGAEDWCMAQYSIGAECTRIQTTRKENGVWAIFITSNWGFATMSSGLSISI